MPTIEIASFNSTGLGLNQADYDVAIIEENKLESHRGLFYDLLRQQNGVIVHIANPDFKDDKEGVFFAGQIIDWDFEPTEIFFPEFDENDEIDWLEPSQEMNLSELIEDELLIAIPIAPVHEANCAKSNMQSGEKPNPFAVLKGHFM